jgi:ribosomal protein L11 methyltransferase
MAKNWTCVSVDAQADIVEELSSEVASRFQLGVELTGTGFRIYLEETLSADVWQPLLEQAINAVRERSHAPFPDPTFRVAPVADEDWAANWKEHFKPLRVGKRLLICPTWEHAAPGSADIILRIDPGRAFGTGHHETTRLCLEWLERCLEQDLAGPSPTLLDVGTGSGILAMAGVLLGFRTAVGIDNDPEAIEVARGNVEANRVDGMVRLFAGTVEEISERFDVVVANIQAGPLVSLADELIRPLKPRGWLALSGILEDQKTDVRQVYESKGMKLHESITDGEWCLLAFSNHVMEKGTANDPNKL